MKCSHGDSGRRRGGKLLLGPLVADPFDSARAGGGLRNAALFTALLTDRTHGNGPLRSGAERDFPRPLEMEEEEEEEEEERERLFSIPQ